MITRAVSYGFLLLVFTLGDWLVSPFHGWFYGPIYIFVSGLAYLFVVSLVRQHRTAPRYKSIHVEQPEWYSIFDSDISNSWQHCRQCLRLVWKYRREHDINSLMETFRGLAPDSTVFNVHITFSSFIFCLVFEWKFDATMWHCEISK